MKLEKPDFHKESIMWSVVVVVDMEVEVDDACNLIDKG